jgi:hypothetical protein
MKKEECNTKGCRHDICMPYSGGCGCTHAESPEDQDGGRFKCTLYDNSVQKYGQCLEKSMVNRNKLEGILVSGEIINDAELHSPATAKNTRVWAPLEIFAGTIMGAGSYELFEMVSNSDPSILGAISQGVGIGVIAGTALVVTLNGFYRAIAGKSYITL